MIFVTIPAWSSEDFQYFIQPEINYWRRQDNASVLLPKELQTTSSNPRSRKSSVKSEFGWDKYLNPNHDEFFKEGDYTPPAPFIEIARNPTDENIQNWFQYLELKNEILHRLQSKLTEYSHKTRSNISTALSSSLNTTLIDDPSALGYTSNRTEKPKPIPSNARRFRLRFYFDSHCMHCQRMIGTISELSKLGYFFELRQVDRDKSKVSHIPFPISDAQAGELQLYGIQAVPVLLVGDLKKETYFKMEGYQTASAVIAALNSYQK